MRRQLCHLLLALLWIVQSTSCAKSQSSSIATAEFYASLRVVGNSSNQVECSATFRVGGVLGTYIELTGNDKVYCSDGAKRVELAKDESLFNTVSYRGGSTLTYEPGRTYTVELERGGGEKHAATTTIPAAVSITAPSGNHTKGTALPVRWGSGTSQGVRLTLSWSSGGNASTLVRTDSDDGAYDFAAADTKTETSGGLVVTGNVQATMTVERHANGASFPSALKGGSIEGAQKATASFTLVD